MRLYKRRLDDILCLIDSLYVAEIVISQNENNLNMLIITVFTTFCDQIFSISFVTYSSMIWASFVHIGNIEVIGNIALNPDVGL